VAGQQVYVRDALHGWSPATVLTTHWNNTPDTVRSLCRPCGMPTAAQMLGFAARTVGSMPGREHHPLL
jgi:hypothetical protein